MDVIDRVPGLAESCGRLRQEIERSAHSRPRLHARARRGRPGDPRLGLAVLTRGLGPRRQRRLGEPEALASSRRTSRRRSSTRSQHAPDERGSGRPPRRPRRAALPRAGADRRRGRVRARRSWPSSRRCTTRPRSPRSARPGACFRSSPTSPSSTPPSTRRSPPRRRPTHCPRSCARWGIRRYGFHGLSVEWASEQVPASRLVVCHLGGGCSVTAVRDGRSVDTTMGFTPLEGVPMATRAGLGGSRRARLPVAPPSDARRSRPRLEHESGLAGLSGLSGDVRELERAERAGRPAGARVFVYRVATAVGAMAVALGGLDALVFTAGIGENSAKRGAGHLRPPRLSRCRARSAGQCVARPGRHHLCPPSSAVRVVVLEAARTSWPPARRGSCSLSRRCRRRRCRPRQA